VKIKILFCLFVIFMLGFLTSCEDVASDSKNIGNTEIVEPLDYGSGLYFFPAVGAVFGNSLSKFLKENKESMEFIDMELNQDSSGVNGYFVYFRLK